jgi:hypothetical protein
VAALWKHAESDTTDLDYYLHQTDRWIVLPYELNGLSQQEIAAHKPELVDLFT